MSTPVTSLFSLKKSYGYEDEMSRADPFKHDAAEIERHTVANQIYPVINQLRDLKRITVEESDKLRNAVNMVVNKESMDTLKTTIDLALANPDQDVNFHKYIADKVPPIAPITPATTAPQTTEDPFANLDPDIFSGGKKAPTFDYQTTKGGAKKKNRSSTTATRHKKKPIADEDNILGDDDKETKQTYQRLRKGDFVMPQAEQVEESDSDEEDGPIDLAAYEEKTLKEAATLKKKSKYKTLVTKMCIDCGFRSQTKGATDGLCSPDRRRLEEMKDRKLAADLRRAEREREKAELDTIKRAEVIEKKRAALAKTAALRDLAEKLNK